MWGSEVGARSAFVLCCLLLTAGCAAERDLWPVERLDPRTAVLTTMMAEPWVYARDVPALAANSRDYLNVGVVETNRTGQRAYWLGVVAWSTIDRSVLPAAQPQLVPSVVRFDWAEGSLELRAVPGGREAVGSDEPIFAGPQPAFEDAWFALTTEQLARLAAQPPDTVTVLRDDQRPLIYAPWRVSPVALQSLLDATGFERRRR